MERNKNVVLKNSTLKATKANKKQERISKQKLQETGITLIAFVINAK